MTYTGEKYTGKILKRDLLDFCGYDLDFEKDYIGVVEALTDYLREEHGEDFSEERTSFETNGDYIYYESETYIADGVDL